ncbi:NAD(P)H-dependent oxidoreductase [Halostella sp. PRR32]|uniref:NADPH-dependent FMN reductase n=1 Tax=Halostella sp. PRR32 TaxID=3098147 RepID=UPI002B1DD7AD|nr:NAD(P)H-dependent oxidoreductase [Halostella sp. PRR32]
MTDTPRIVAVPGSLRDESYTRTALVYALRAAEHAGADAELLDLREYDLPLYDPDLDEPGDSELVKRKTREADGLILGSPTYHNSYSAAFRNVHDYWSYDEFEETVTGLLTVAGGSSYGSTLDHMRITIRGVHGWVLPHQVGIPNVYDQFEADADAPDGRAFVDDDLQDRVEKLGRLVTEHAESDPVVSGSEAAADD